MHFKRLLAVKVVLLQTAFLWGVVNGSPQPVPLFATDQEDLFVEARNPYEFGYEFGDRLGAKQYRKEVSYGNGLVEGSYGYFDPDGTYRNVEYKADSSGYRTVIKSNERGLDNQNPADVTFVIEPPSDGALAKNSVLSDAQAGVKDA